MLDSSHFDVCTAFLDAYGINVIGSIVEHAELRLLIGYDLSDIPIAQDIITFQMADEWKVTGEDPFNPQIFSVMPETFRPEYLDLFGNGDLLESPKIGLVCSIKCPGNVILKTMNLMQSLKDAGLCFISGFHSPLEQECLSLLMRSKNRLIICPARSIQKMRLPLEYREAMMANRLAIISPFGGKYQRASEENAEIRNRFVAALADRVLVLHAAPGGKIEKLVKEISGWGKPVYTINMFPCEVNNEQFHHKD